MARCSRIATSSVASRGGARFELLSDVSLEGVVVHVEGTRHADRVAGRLESLAGAREVLGRGSEIAPAAQQLPEAIVQLSDPPRVPPGLREPKPPLVPRLGARPLALRQGQQAEPFARGDRASLIELRFRQREPALAVARPVRVPAQGVAHAA